ncbi:MAG: universal stress protein [bacterium]|nr:universal stress protein [bacterium]
MITLNPSKILIPVDFSLTSMHAIKHGALLVKKSKGELFLLHVKRKKEIENIVFPTTELRGMAEETKSILEHLEDLGRNIKKEFDITVTALVAVGSRPVEIVNTAEKNKVGLIVMGTQGSDSTSTFFSGSNSYRVIKKSTIPVMTFRAEAPHLGFSKILLPIDSSEHSPQKINSAMQMAKLCASTIHVIGILGKKETEFEQKIRNILEKIEHQAKEENLTCSSEVIKTDNPVGKTLSQAKRVKADIIITMTDQRAGSNGFWFGNYDHQLVDESEIPVLSIPPELHEKS